MPSKILKEIDDNINYEGSRIDFKILFLKRKNLSIIIYPDKSVKVRVPYRTSIKYIKNLIERRAEWILSRQKKLENYIPKRSRKYENGEHYLFLGKKYYLQVIYDLVNKVEIYGENLIVRVTKFNKEKVSKLTNNWFQETAKQIFLERLEVCKVLASSKAGIKYNGIPKFRKMKSRWGSCSRRGDITLSYELIKTPLESVDYVMVHELCHLKEFNHSKAFYDLVEKIMPDWKERKNKLKGIKEDYCE